MFAYFLIIISFIVQPSMGINSGSMSLIDEINSKKMSLHAFEIYMDNWADDLSTTVKHSYQNIDFIFAKIHDNFTTIISTFYDILDDKNSTSIDIESEEIQSSEPTNITEFENHFKKWEAELNSCINNASKIVNHLMCQAKLFDMKLKPPTTIIYSDNKNTSYYRYLGNRPIQYCTDVTAAIKIYEKYYCERLQKVIDLCKVNDNNCTFYAVNWINLKLYGFSSLMNQVFVTMENDVKIFQNYYEKIDRLKTNTIPLLDL